MTNSYDVDHGLSQCPPGPLEPVEIAQQDDTLARTGNTARDQEMYAAGIAVGEANAKHNAAIRASMPDGWELVTRKTCYALMHDGAVIATLAGPESETNAAIIARMLAAPGVSTVEADAVKRLRDAIKGEFGGTWISEKQAIAVLTHLGGNAPAAGDALDAVDWYERRRELESGMIFRTASGVVQLDRPVPGDGTKWYVLAWNGDGWSAYDDTVEPVDLIGAPVANHPIAIELARAALAAQRKGDA